jgi:hypothetical protein
VGSFRGPKGAGSVSEGVVSAIGRLRRDGAPTDVGRPLVSDQYSLVVHKGSSGGGVFSKSSGECLGLVDEFLDAAKDGLSYGAGLIVPARRIREYAETGRGEVCSRARRARIPEGLLAGPINTSPIDLAEGVAGARVRGRPGLAVPDRVREVRGVPGAEEVVKLKFCPPIQELLDTTVWSDGPYPGIRRIPGTLRSTVTLDRHDKRNRRYYFRCSQGHQFTLSEAEVKNWLANWEVRSWVDELAAFIPCSQCQALNILLQAAGPSR